MEIKYLVTLLVALWAIVQVHDHFNIHNAIFCFIARYYANTITSSLFGVLIGTLWAIFDSDQFKSILPKLNAGDNSVFINKFFQGKKLNLDTANTTFALLFYLSLLILFR